MKIVFGNNLLQPFLLHFLQHSGVEKRDGGPRKTPTRPVRGIETTDFLGGRITSPNLKLCSRFRARPRAHFLTLQLDIRHVEDLYFNHYGSLVAGSYEV